MPKISAAAREVVQKPLSLWYPESVEERIYGFPPVTGEAPKVLILGSMPSVRSLAMQQYYGHPRNHFWEIVFRVLGKALPEEYPERIEGLKASGIALWDAISHCRREGSLDQAIEEEVFNDVGGFIRRHPSLRLVVFNGRKAEQAFRSGVLEQDSGDVEQRCRYLRLPSTSPIPTRKYRNLADKLEAWMVIAEYLDGE
ncbi:MAG: DNA-deoxyinosine glycosylase [Sediminispirochaetaceae bacterium]